MGILTTWSNGVLGEDGKESADFRGASCFRAMWGWCTQGRRGRGCCSTRAVGMSSVLEGGKVEHGLGILVGPLCSHSASGTLFSASELHAPSSPQLPLCPT